MGVTLPISHSVGGIIVAEMFPASVRYSGTSLIVQPSVILGGALAPLIATALWTAGSTSMAVSCYIVAVCAVSTISTAGLCWALPNRASHTQDEIAVPVPVG